ncbi:hypothetical protein DY000_02033436 [Brassica cretica]|uniref:Uncharacterized protein n=1 Tax=Brassica cretica TaxID=69181 RepID=A0ABQ7DG49_BRACR|nr:hypothetical protein DY000_02033436 [Brassica cretica]
MIRNLNYDRENSTLDKLSPIMESERTHNGGVGVVALQGSQLVTVFPVRELLKGEGQPGIHGAGSSRGAGCYNAQLVTAYHVGELLKGEVLGSSSAKRINNLHGGVSEGAHVRAIAFDLSQRCLPRHLIRASTPLSFLPFSSFHICPLIHLSSSNYFAGPRIFRYKEFRYFLNESLNFAATEGHPLSISSPFLPLVTNFTVSTVTPDTKPALFTDKKKLYLLCVGTKIRTVDFHLN